MDPLPSRSLSTTQVGIWSSYIRSTNAAAASLTASDCSFCDLGRGVLPRFVLHWVSLGQIAGDHVERVHAAQRRDDLLDHILIGQESLILLAFFTPVIRDYLSLYGP